MLVYLLGFMGSGKTTLGKKLSKRLGTTYIDLDTAIEDIEGRSVSKIFSDEGEDYFRRIESEVLRSSSKIPNLIISCGGGTPCFEGNMDYMNKTGQTVYIEMTAAALLSRLKKSREKQAPYSKFRRQETFIIYKSTLGEREEWYRKAKHIIGGLNPDITQLSSLLQAPAPYNP